MKKQCMHLIIAGVLTVFTGRATAQGITNTSAFFKNPSGTTGFSGATLHVDGDVKFSQTPYSSDYISFALPNGENGMSFMSSSTSRADLRFNGTSIKLLATPGGSGAPAATNGLTVSTWLGYVGIGADTAAARLQVNQPVYTPYAMFVNGNNYNAALRVRRDNNGNINHNMLGIDYPSAAFTSFLNSTTTWALAADNSDDEGVITGGGYFGGSNLGAAGIVQSFRGANDNATGLAGYSGLFYSGSGAPMIRIGYGVRGMSEQASFSNGGSFYASSDNFARGVEAVGEGIGDCMLAYGLTASASNAQVNYGIYASTGSSGLNYAGFFNGNVHATGMVTWSDERLKEDIQPLQKPLEVLAKLDPKSYRFRTDIKGLNLPKGLSYGLIAQEVERVLPNLVKQAVHPAQFDKDGKKTAEQVAFKGLDYVSLIPFLIGGINEQQATIQALNNRIANLEIMVKNLSAGSLSKDVRVGDIGTFDGIKLDQNNPNPFTENTIISFTIPVTAGISTAAIYVYDLTGKQVKKYVVEANGNGTLQIKAGELPAGMFIYTLICNDQVIDSKHMIIKD